MAHATEPEQRAPASDESLDGEDEEQEPLLPRIAWAQPRRSAPGTAVRLVEAAREKDAASPGEDDDKELPRRTQDSHRHPSRDVEVPPTSPVGVERNRFRGSGATRLLPSPRGPPRAPVAAQVPRLLGPPLRGPRPAPARFSGSHGHLGGRTGVCRASRPGRRSGARRPDPDTFLACRSCSRPLPVLHLSQGL